MISEGAIELRGVRVHNLKSIDLDLDRNQLVVLCGVSGSGKTSLALDTLYAEGQRRYIESFSAYTRQFLERLDKPDAESIEGIPPAIAVTRTQPSLSSRSTVGTATETVEYLRLLFSKIAEAHCPNCGQRIQQDSPPSILTWLESLPIGRRIMIVARVKQSVPAQRGMAYEELIEQGFARVIVENRIVDLHDGSSQHRIDANEIEVIIDRLVSGRLKPQRVQESLETALRVGEGNCRIYVQGDDSESETRRDSSPEVDRMSDGDPTRANVQQQVIEKLAELPTVSLRDELWSVADFGVRLNCGRCDIELPSPEPRLFSFNSPLGACPECEGFGSTFAPDMNLIVPDPGKTLREGAIACWNSKAYSREYHAMIRLARDCDLPLDVPFRDLTESQSLIVSSGIPETEFTGIDGFFGWLEKRAFKTHHRAFLSRWRSERRCCACEGSRLRPEAMAFRIGGMRIDQMCNEEIARTADRFDSLQLNATQRAVVQDVWRQLISRLRFLIRVGLGYLTLDRPLRTLSGGEAQRVALTSALGSTLVNMLYILDEPTVGLHPEDVSRLQQSILNLRDRGNTVVVVEHEPTILQVADEIVEVGPGAGDGGGSIVFQGDPRDLLESRDSVTADFLTGRRGASLPNQRRSPTHGRIKLTGACGNNLKNISVEFPLGVLCLVTGVSGAGKSTLVQDTLYGALCRRKRKDGVPALPFDDVLGDGQIEDVILVDQSPIGRTPRSNPVTYIKAFDDIRNVFAETLEARTRNLTASHFSFNVDGGRCTRCQGDGYLSIDMQFLADVYMRCPQCKGTRYRKEILDVTYRGMNIADVLDMTVRKAFSFFRGQVKLQTKLKRLIDVGLDYLKLGQPATTLSSGEAQRLKLASFTGTKKQQRTLFLLDEPTTGLHFSDIVKLIDCFEALLSVGHSIIVIEHNLQLMKAADYIIDLGPGAATEGGEVVVEGTPEEVAACDRSLTGLHLREILRAASNEPVS